MTTSGTAPASGNPTLYAVFPFYRVGRKILYDRQEVRDLIRAGRVDASGNGDRAA